MTSVIELISLWPRAIDLARELDVSPPRISDWKNRNAIPVGYWQAILDSAERRRITGVTAELLVAMHDTGGGERQGLREDGAHSPDFRMPESKSREADRTGHFSRHKPYRRAHFRTGEEIEDHIRALREEWSHR